MRVAGDRNVAHVKPAAFVHVNPDRHVTAVLFELYIVIKDLKINKPIFGMKFGKFLGEILLKFFFIITAPAPELEVAFLFRRDRSAKFPIVEKFVSLELDFSDPDLVALFDLQSDLRASGNLCVLYNRCNLCIIVAFLAIKLDYPVNRFLDFGGGKKTAHTKGDFLFDLLLFEFLVSLDGQLGDNGAFFDPDSYFQALGNLLGQDIDIRIEAGVPEIPDRSLDQKDRIVISDIDLGSRENPSCGNPAVTLNHDFNHFLPGFLCSQPRRPARPLSQEKERESDK